MGERPERKGQIEDLVGNQNPGLEAPPRSRRDQKRREERWKRFGMSRSLREKKSGEMTQSNTSSPRGSEVSLESQRG